MAADKAGGYDYELVCTSGQERYICWICHNLLREPTLTSCCGQHYCWTCLQTWLEQRGHKQCPQCRKEFNYMVNQERNRDVLDLQVKCTHSTLGCCFTGKLKNMDDHVASCSDVEIQCKLNCKEKIKHVDHDKHVKYECLNREYECQFCQYKSKYSDITGETVMTPYNPPTALRAIPPEKGHYAQCPHYPITCPNKCGMTIKRKLVQEHRATCPKERVICTHRIRTSSRYWPVLGLREERQSMWMPPRIEQCNEFMERQFLPTHRQYECLYRIYTCQFCNLERTYKEITGETKTKKYNPSSVPNTEHDAMLNPPPERGHYAQCKRYPLHCPNNCREEVILREDMPSHRQQCPLEPVECPFTEAGCRVKLVRKDLEGHVKNSTTEHLTGLLGAFMETKKELKATKKALAETQARLPPKRR